MSQHQVQVFDDREQAMREFEAAGAVVAKDLASLARSCDVVVICAMQGKEARDIVFGPNGLLKGLSPGKVIVDMTTALPTETRTVAADLLKLGVHLIDAPVHTESWDDLERMGTILCGGQLSSVDAVRPILEAVCHKFV